MQLRRKEAHMLTIDSLAEQQSVLPRTSWQAWVVVFTATLFFFFEFMQINMFNAINPALLVEFKISAARLGQVSAHFFYGNLLFLFPAGMILDRFSTRKVILIAMTISVVSTFIFSLAHTIITAEFCRFVTGMSGAFGFLSSLRLASRWFPPRRLALVIGLIVTFAMVGAMVAQTPFTLLTDYYGWRKVLTIDACAGIIMLLLIAIFVRDFPPNQNADAHKHHHSYMGGFWLAIMQSLKNTQNWFGGIYTSLMNLPIFLLGAMWGGLYLVQAHHLTRAQSSYVTSMIFFGTIIGSPILGWLSDRIARRRMPMIICAIISLINILIIIYLPNLSLLNLMILFLTLGFFTSAQIISYPLIAESNSLELTGTAEGLAATLIIAGGLLQPVFGWLMGLYWNHTVINDLPFYSPTNFLLAMSLIPVGFGISVIVSLLLRETYCRRSEINL